ncbi:MAG TPA: cytochrome P450, partial [Acidimicrobiia bacterium]|nr:cytochrome P450 [Acidimicrobiia bacterium]
MTAEVDPLDLVDAARYARRGYPHDVWTRLRAEEPVAYVTPDGYEPFWAVTKHADVLEVARQPTLFSSAQGISLRRAGEIVPPADMLVMLDPPRHAPMRRVANARFTPRGVRALDGDLDRMVLEILDAAVPAGDSGELDFVERLAAPFPLAAMAWILGVPSEDWPL